MMTRFIALLRGINVGGNNIIAMPELKDAFEQAGFTDVSTYINSGNVIFDVDDERGRRIEAARAEAVSTQRALAEEAAAAEAQIEAPNAAEGRNLALKAFCERLIEERFGLSIAVNIVSADALRDAIVHAPQWWNTDPDSKHNAIFVIPPLTADDIMAEVGAVKPEFEKVGSWGRVIFWSAPKATFSITRWSKITKSRHAYDHITIRNANTACKLDSLASR